MKVTLNINDQVKVKLTSWGERLLVEHMYRESKYGLDYPIYNPRFVKDVSYPKGKDGRYTFTLWQIAMIFGEEFYHGCDQIFENNALELVADIAEEKTSGWIDIWDRDGLGGTDSALCPYCNAINKRPVGRYCRWCGGKVNE